MQWRLLKFPQIDQLLHRFCEHSAQSNQVVEPPLQHSWMSGVRHCESDVSRVVLVLPEMGQNRVYFHTRFGSLGSSAVVTVWARSSMNNDTVVGSTTRKRLVCGTKDISRGCYNMNNMFLWVSREMPSVHTFLLTFWGNLHCFFRFLIKRLYRLCENISGGLPGYFFVVVVQWLRWWRCLWG